MIAVERQHLQRLLATVAAAAMGVAASSCSGSSGSSSAPLTVPQSGTLPHGSVPLPPAAGASRPSPTTVPAGPARETVVSVPGSGTYTLTLAPVGGDGPCPTHGLGGAFVAFSVSLSNEGSATEALARVGLSISDPSASVRPVVAISYQGLCTDFTEPGGTLAPGQTVTYRGTVSGTTGSSFITANVISTPVNDVLGTISLTVHTA